MKRVTVVILMCLIVCPVTSAVLITLFMNTDTYIKRAKDIVVARCASKPVQASRENGFRVVEVDILKVLKGGRKTGPYRIATIYPMKPQTTYMLYNLGGSVVGTDFLAVPELSVVPLPQTFKVADLKHKTLKEQVQYMFSLRLFEVERKLAPLLREKDLLEKAVSDRAYEWFQSKGSVKTTPVVKVSTRTDGTHRIWLDIESKKLSWSQSSAGKDGFFYFQKMDGSMTPYWEFSPCDETRIEDVVGKPLRIRFYGMYTPGRGDTNLGWNSSQSICVRVGQVLFARTIDAPNKVYIIQIVSQKKDEEQMTARYTMIRH